MHPLEPGGKRDLARLGIEIVHEQHPIVAPVILQSRCLPFLSAWLCSSRQLTRAGPRGFWFHFGDIEIGPSSPRRRVKFIENLVTGERHVLEWGGVRLRIDQQQDPALLFRCFT